MHNNNIFGVKENLNIDINNNDKKVERDKICNKYIFNENYCYNKFKNRNNKNLLYQNNNNKNNQIGQNTNTPLSNNKIDIFSPLYTKVNIRKNTSINILDQNKFHNKLNKGKTGGKNYKIKPSKTLYNS